MAGIVAGNTPFAPFMAGDIRVTIAGKDGCDCLLKIHPVAPNVIGGFAGSVYGGFALLDAVRERFRSDPRGLVAAAFDWMPVVMKEAFDRLDDDVKAGQSHLVFIGVDPVPEVIPTIPQPDTFRFASPNFEPEQAHRFAGFFGIGTGTVVDAYEREATSAATSGYLQSVYRANGWDAPALMLADRLQRVVSASPDPTVSTFFTFGTVGREGMRVAPYNYTERVGDGPEIAVNVPWVALSWNELWEHLKKKGFVAAGTVPGAVTSSAPEDADVGPA